MNMHWIDWSIVVIVIAFITTVAYSTKKYTKSVADFLAANRSAGRYILNVSDDMSGIGAITVLGYFEIYYHAGFPAAWWGLMGLPLGMILAATGWVIYRFRQTRVLTMAQFFEARYSKNFRIFAGLLSFLSGVINFAIFPAVSARFFIYFCGLPQTIQIFGFGLSTFALIMIAMLSLAVYFTLASGQITVIITDFIQGILCQIAVTTIIVFLLFKFDWSIIAESLTATASNSPMLHPYQTSHIKDFNIWFFLILLFGNVYNFMSWQGNQAYNCSATTAHEARMSKVLGRLRGMMWTLILILLPICAYVVMHHSDYASMANSINSLLDNISANPEDTIRKQMLVPIVLSNILPIGLMGAFCAVMFSAAISTQDTYLHSWGSIFIQDVVLPLRKKPITPKQHLWLLRFSIIGVAIFIFCFSLLFKQTSYIFMYLAISAAIFMGGAGSVIIGGLYWKKGTTAAAWSSMIVGSVLAASGLIIHQIWEDFFLNQQWMFFISMIGSISTYIFVSLFNKKTQFNMDKILHRGQYTIKEEQSCDMAPNTEKGWKALRFTKEFTRGDKIIYLIVITWTFCWWFTFIIGTIINTTCDIKVQTWATFWQAYIWISLIAAIATTLWFTIGGLIDLKSMFRKLRTIQRDDLDDGSVN